MYVPHSKALVTLYFTHKITRFVCVNVLGFKMYAGCVSCGTGTEISNFYCDTIVFFRIFILSRNGQ
jgi:hypothetical protein